MHRMGHEPYRFIREHSEADLKNLLGFRHRTFQEEDLFYFVRFLRHHYERYPSLETAFLVRTDEGKTQVSMEQFYTRFFSLTEVPNRTRKHISHPGTSSTCKRLCMYLRWMVRSGQNGVDFGLWKKIKPRQLYIPLDVHVDRVARSLQLLRSEKKNWQSVEELTQNLRLLDPTDPVKYDFALFNLGQLKHPLQDVFL